MSALQISHYAAVTLWGLAPKRFVRNDREECECTADFSRRGSHSVRLVPERSVRNDRGSETEELRSP